MPSPQGPLCGGSGRMKKEKGKRKNEKGEGEKATGCRVAPRQRRKLKITNYELRIIRRMPWQKLRIGARNWHASP